MIQVWRIGFVADPLPPPPEILSSLGFGSTLGNGRWHIKGLTQVVYTGSSRALCQLEKRVHANGSNLKNQTLVRLEIDGGATLLDVNALGLPANWRMDEAATQAIGMAWLAGNKSLGLWVPSFVEPHDNNLLLNPAHPDYSKVQLVVERNPFVFDPRLFL